MSRVLTLVLEAFESSCKEVARSSKKEDLSFDDPLMSAAANMILLIGGAGRSTLFEVFRTMLMNAEYAHEEAAEVEQMLKKIEADCANSETVLVGASLIRAHIQESLDQQASNARVIAHHHV